MDEKLWTTFDYGWHEDGSQGRGYTCLRGPTLNYFRKLTKCNECTRGVKNNSTEKLSKLSKILPQLTLAINIDTQLGAQLANSWYDIHEVLALRRCQHYSSASTEQDGMRSAKRKWPLLVRQRTYVCTARLFIWWAFTRDCSHYLKQNRFAVWFCLIFHLYDQVAAGSVWFCRSCEKRTGSGSGDVNSN